MNGDHHYYPSGDTNAVAGPSKTSTPSSPSSHLHSGALGATPSATGGPPFASTSPPHHFGTTASVGLFLPPPIPPPLKQHLEATQDLLARFHLHAAYDRYVRPAILPGNDAAGSTLGMATPSTPLDKGKGKEIDMDVGESGQDVGSGTGFGGDAEDEDGAGGKGEKKKKNSYKHLIKGIPGKHSTKKDDYLTSIMLVPPKQPLRITPFDLTTQEDAFTVSLEGLKGWNVNALVLESAQAREDRKKRKELKRLAKAQQLQQQQQHQQSSDQQPPPSAIPLQTPIPTSSNASSSFRPQSVGTPMHNPSTPRSAVTGSGTPRPGSTIPQPGSAKSTTTPISSMPPTNTIIGGQRQPNYSTVPRPGSTVPRPGSAASTSNAAPPQRPRSTKPMPGGTGTGTPIRTATPNFGSGLQGPPRGKKREREDGVGQTNGTNGVGVVNGVGLGITQSSGGRPPKAVVNAKAGVVGIRPRPVKKQRMDTQGQTRDSNAPIQQQPTPQGV